ncbi:MAG: Lar family restriction alleviation protein [Bulleidia sp.]
MNNVRLRKCPICNSPAQLIIDWDGGRATGKYNQYVCCCKCGTHGEPKPNEHEAIESWNSISLHGMQLSLF